MKKKKLLSLLLVTSMFASLAAGCGSGSDTETGSKADGDVKEFTAFFAVPGSEINDDNEIASKKQQMNDERKSYEAYSKQLDEVLNSFPVMRFVS